MCTVSFIPRETGYYLAMNRDEQLARIAGLPPEQKIVNGRAALFPSEPNGGTWISLNESRACFALINWYSVETRVRGESTTRGEVVKSVSACDTVAGAEEELARLPLNQINPFRLIGIFPDRCEAIEWQWDLKQLVQKNHPWQAQQWISSGYDEPAAQLMRSATFQQAQLEESAQTLAWLRRLHGSHNPDCGPFSTCMHRDDAGTVSYTEVVVEEGRSRMGYRSGPPCHSSEVLSCDLVRPEPVSQVL